MEAVRVLVTDFDKCFKFYSEELGLKVIWGELGNVYASFDNGSGAEIGLFNSDLMAEYIGNEKEPLPNNKRERVMITIRVENLDEKYEMMTKKGIVFLNKPTDKTDWGMRLVHLRDPEGNLVELYHELEQPK